MTDERLDRDFARLEEAERVTEAAWKAAEKAKAEWMRDNAAGMMRIIEDYRDTVICSVSDHDLAVEIFADMEHPFDIALMREFAKTKGGK